MAEQGGFLRYERAEIPERPAEQRIGDWRDTHVRPSAEQLQQQSARCMDCGVPFCTTGCPLGNIIPDWNDLVYRDRWRAALKRLHSTNNFPEFTGALCPAPCEASCVLNIDGSPTSIKQIEQAIVERGWDEGWIQPQPPPRSTGRRIGIVGSGPAGLAAAQQLRRAGHEVVLYEKNERPGGLLRLGIPDFKLEKRVIDRRVAQLEAEGVDFVCGVTVGSPELPVSDLRAEFDAVLLACGSDQPRDLPIPGRDLAGVHFAMSYLRQANRRIALRDDSAAPILATGKDVVVIGGGDTGSDCVGTALRQGAASVTSLELMPRPPIEAPSATWPRWPHLFRSSSSHAEGGYRRYAVRTKQLRGEGGRVTGLQTVEVDFVDGERGGPPRLRELPGTERWIPADLVLLAMGFVHPIRDGLIEALGIELDERGNVAAPAQDLAGSPRGAYETTLPGVFAAGDVRRGQSLVVWAINEGRGCAAAVDAWLMG